MLLLGVIVDVLILLLLIVDELFPNILLEVDVAEGNTWNAVWLAGDPVAELMAEFENIGGRSFFRGL